MEIHHLAASRHEPGRQLKDERSEVRRRGISLTNGLKDVYTQSSPTSSLFPSTEKARDPEIRFRSSSASVRRRRD